MQSTMSNEPEVVCSIFSFDWLDAYASFDPNTLTNIVRPISGSQWWAAWLLRPDHFDCTARFDHYLVVYGPNYHVVSSLCQIGRIVVHLNESFLPYAHHLFGILLSTCLAMGQNRTKWLNIFESKTRFLVKTLIVLHHLINLTNHNFPMSHRIHLT